MSFFEEAAGFRFCQGQRDYEVAGSLVLGFQVGGYARSLVRGGKSNLIRLDFLFWLPFSLLYLKLFQPFTLYIVTKNSQKVKYSFLIFAITFIYTSFLFHSFMV